MPASPLPPDRLRRRLMLNAVPLLVTLPWLRPALADPTLRRASRVLMGTRVDLSAQADSPRHAAEVDAALAAAFDEMARQAALMSRYRPGSLVNALHRAAGRQALAVPAEMMAVLRMARNISERSTGNFDITVGAYDGWDFSAGHQNIPSSLEISSQRPLVDYRQVIIDETQSRVYLSHPGMKIDLGGIAKLPILQAGMACLRQRGVHNAMLNGGGDVLVHGQLQGRDWRVGVRDPRQPERLLGVVALNEGFVASSGDYERCFVRAGRRYHHVLDPRSGQPSRGPGGVALVSRRLEAINGLGAAIMVAGAEAGRRWLAALPSVDAMIAGPGQELWLSGGMEARLQA